MKKIIFLMAFTAFTLGLNAEIKYFRAFSMNVSVDDESSGWLDADVFISWNYDTHRVVINSNNKRIIDYEFAERKYDNGAIHLIYRGTDSGHIGMLLIYSVLPNGNKYISLTSTNELVMYRVVELGEN